MTSQTERKQDSELNMSELAAVVGGAPTNHHVGMSLGGDRFVEYRGRKLTD